MSEEEANVVEQEAMANGWVPQEEYKGNPDNWKTAEEFNKTGKNIAAVQSERNRKLVSEIESMKQTMQEMQKSQFDLIREARTDAYNKALEKLKSEQKQAFQEGDETKFDRVTEKIEKLEPPKVEEPKKNDQHSPAPELVSWMAKNTWYNSDSDLTSDADMIGEKLARQGLSGQKWLDEIEKQVKRLNPDKFETKTSVSKVEGGSSSGGGNGAGKKKTYSDLPPEAKKACDRFVKDMGMKKEDYVKEYFGE